ncbi:methylthioribulose-1-phosphate dehydratase-like [Panonychus citri]|uniref:methylthioribulose-1-phosphate dehydratase-like n=1 Tax=Panonychus citri TaxID=50023 RepID=UPI0023080CF5|nr:methylthioribulose-1-phosphate dehydratase-like [Panonychus citri]
MSINILDEEDGKKLIPYLCNHFYSLGWVSGTGGGMSVRIGDRIFIAPSGVQKELIKSEDIFVINGDGETIEDPVNCNLKKSECTPLFLAAYSLRSAGAVIHSHSLFSVLATIITNGSEFKITKQEMIKGIKKGSSNVSHRYDDTLIVPIIENTCFECDLTESLTEAIKKYPDTNAVLVRNHGVYIWGANWKQAKSMAECYDYLFKVAVEMKKLGIPYN